VNIASSLLYIYNGSGVSVVVDDVVVFVAVVIILTTTEANTALRM